MKRLSEKFINKRKAKEMWKGKLEEREMKEKLNQLKLGKLKEKKIEKYNYGKDIKANIKAKTEKKKHLAEGLSCFSIIITMCTKWGP